MRYLLVLNFIIVAVSGLAADWIKSARRLTGESDLVTRNSIRRLREIPKLSDILISALDGPNKFLALDAIVALSLKTELPALFEHSQTDDNGATFLAISALLDKDNQAKIERFYLNRINGESNVVSIPGQVVILDTLGRLGSALTRGKVAELLHQPNYDLRLAALYYSRLLLLRGQALYLPLLQESLALSPYQLRLQTLSIISELPLELKKIALTYVKDCPRQYPLEVKAECEKLTASAK